MEVVAAAYRSELRGIFTVKEEEATLNGADPKLNSRSLVCFVPTFFSTLQPVSSGATSTVRDKSAISGDCFLFIEVCSCLLAIAKAFHLPHTFLPPLLVCAHIHLEGCSLTASTLTSLPLCADSVFAFSFASHSTSFFSPLSSVLVFLASFVFTHVRPLSQRLHAQHQDGCDLGRHRAKFIGEGFACDRIIFIIPSVFCLEMKVKIN